MNLTGLDWNNNSEHAFSSGSVNSHRTSPAREMQLTIAGSLRLQPIARLQSRPR